MNLVIDIGNTRVKLAVFQGVEVLEIRSGEFKDLIEITVGLYGNYSISKIIVSSVVDLEQALRLKLEELVLVLYLDNTTSVPFKNNYKTPQTLGVDRIALVAAASQRFPSQNVLVIDAGTCITYDFINEHNEFQGGSISPGVAMRYKSLNKFTGKLPLLEKEFNDNLVGKDTFSAIHSGVIHGVLFEILGVIKTYEQQFEKIQVVLSGGDSNFLAKRLKSSIFVEPNFLLYGLNYILNYNNNNVE